MDINLNQAIGILAGNRAKDALENSELYNGNHLQPLNSFRGYIGILPQTGDPDYGRVIEWLKRIYAASNMVKGAVNRNIDGTLSREPDWSLKFPRDTPEKRVEELSAELDETIVDWWNEQQILQRALREAAKIALLEGECFVRPRVPVSMRDGNGRLSAQTLADAINLIDFEVLTSEKAGIFTDSETGKKYSLCITTNEKNEQIGELSYTGADGLTYLKIMSGDDIKLWTNQTFPTIAKYISDPANRALITDAAAIDLGGRLFLQKITRAQLIGTPERSLQYSVNFALTTMNKNLNIAGSKRIDFGNAQKPKIVTETKDASGAVTARTEKDAALSNSTANSNFLIGLPNYDFTKQDASGRPAIVGYSPVQQFVVDPTAVETFVKAFEAYERLFLDGVHQGHILANNLTVSGKSKQESRSEFEKSLKATKTAIDPLGRWLLEFSVKFAAATSNRTEDFKGLRLDFNCQITVGAVDLEEVKHAAEDVKDGRISLFDYLVLKGTEDPDAQIERIKKADGYVLSQLEHAAEIYQKATGAIPLKLIVEFLPVSEKEKEAILLLLPEIIAPPTSKPPMTAPMVN